MTRTLKEWDARTIYRAGDVVSLGPGLYLANRLHCGRAPDRTTGYWVLLTPVEPQP